MKLGKEPEVAGADQVPGRLKTGDGRSLGFGRAAAFDPKPFFGLADLMYESGHSCRCLVPQAGRL